MGEDAYEIGYEEIDGESWIRVAGGELTQPVHLKFGKQDGRRFVSGIRIENDREIRGSDLRSIPIARIAEEVARQFTPERPAYRPPDMPDIDRILKDIEHEAVEDLYLDALLDTSASTAVARRSRGPGAPPPREDELLAFADHYRRELAARPHGAMTRTTRAFLMNRTTGYKWLAWCRDRGLLLAEEDT